MDYLSVASLDWALAHLQKRGDGDIFPIPRELAAISESWDEVKSHLAGTDVAQYIVRSHRSLLVPKPGGGFRVAVQLDPLDSVMYAALVHEMAPRIEAMRAPVESRIACSYRIELSADGSLFRESTGWKDFQERSKELSATADGAWVLEADIADFYNNAYHHRIENALETAGVGIARAKNVEKFLGQMTAKQSRGLPVGPYPSIVLAEACLDDLDKFLINHGRRHVRYVDDIRVFCRTKAEAVRALHDIVEYLYTAHRLSLQGSKTRIRDAAAFRKEALFDPEAEEAQTRLERVSAIVAEAMSEMYAPPEDVEDVAVSAEEIDREAEGNLSELFRSCIETRPLHLGRARFLLRKARALGSRCLLPLSGEDLEVLAPVYRDVARYLARVLEAGQDAGLIAKMLGHMQSQGHGTIPFILVWTVDLISQRTFGATCAQAQVMAAQLPLQWQVWAGAQLARAYGQVDWMRSVKEEWANNSPWARRAIILASPVLPLDERKAWWQGVRKTGERLEGFLVKHLEAGT